MDPGLKKKGAENVKGYMCNKLMSTYISLMLCQGQFYSALFLMRGQYWSDTLEKNLNFLTQYSCRILDCPLAFLTFIKFPEVQDRVHFPSISCTCPEILMISRIGGGNSIGEYALPSTSGNSGIKSKEMAVEIRGEW